MGRERKRDGVRERKRDGGRERERERERKRKRKREGGRERNQAEYTGIEEMRKEDLLSSVVDTRKAVIV